MTNPIGLSLIISTHKQHTDTNTQTHTDGLKVSQTTVKMGFKDKMIESLFEDKLLPLGKNLQYKCTGGGEGVLEMLKHFKFFEMLKSVFFFIFMFTGESLKDSIRVPVVNLTS